MSSRVDRGRMFRAWDADSTHQRLAGLASWAAFSARWRAHQGLPLLHPMDVQYLTPQDFSNGLGRPLPAAEQRRLFRAYVNAAIAQGTSTPAEAAPALVRQAGLVSGDLAFVRVSGFQRRFELSPDYIYGRDDLLPYAAENIAPSRPYGVPVTSETASPCWFDAACADGGADEYAGEYVDGNADW